jgi:hypothetical protein
MKDKDTVKVLLRPIKLTNYDLYTPIITIIIISINELDKLWKEEY